MSADLLARGLAAQAIGTVGLRARTHQGPLVAAVGDSLTAQSVTKGTSGTYAYNNRGYLAWWRNLSGCRFRLPLDNNLGVGGTTLAQIATTVPAALALKPDILMIEGGTNDLRASNSFVSMQATMTGMIAQTIAAGVRPIVLCIPPLSALSTTQWKTLGRYNHWLRSLGHGHGSSVSAAALPYNILPIVVDQWPYLADYATASSPIAAYTQEGTHPNALGGFWGGMALHDALTPLLPFRPTLGVTPCDFYSTSEDTNPTGNLIFGTNGTGDTVSRGLMAGTAGTKTASTGFTPSGSVADGWDVSRASGTSTMTAVASKENPRADYPYGSGERQRLQINATSAGLAVETVNLSIASNAAVAPGDIVVAECQIELMSCANLLGIQLRVSDNPGGSVFGIDGAVTTSDAVLGLLPNRNVKYVMMTPPITLPAGATGVAMAISVRVKTSGGSASADFYASNVSLRKVI